MAGDWIKIRTSLPQDGRVRIAAKILKKGNALGNATTNAYCVTVFGALVTLWAFADDQADEEGLLVGYDFDDINDMVGIDGFCESLPSDWIELSGEYVKLPDYQEHNGKNAKKRAQTAKRVANAKANAKSVTELAQEALPDALPREEKRREENKKNIKKKISKFVKPNYQEVEAYAQSRQALHLAKPFFDYFEAGDWKDAKLNQVKNWKQKFITWQSRDNTPPAQIYKEAGVPE